MEKLLIEEKAKLYDEAIERAKIKRDEYIRLDGPKSHVLQDIEFIFPELVESEDEKIRKELIEFFNQFENGELRGVDITPWIAWIEKQAEQKSADKVEPKFKVDSFIVNNSRGVCQVTEIRDDEYCLYPLYGEIMGYLKIIDVDNEYHLWTIKDAKDGDVLFFNDGHGNDCIELIKSITDKKIEFWFCLTNGNHYEVFDGITPYTNFASREDAHPATQEQRELLFAKMKEAGYEWDMEKKEMRKIEQKSAAYFYCKCVGTTLKCGDCVRNHLNSKYKIEDIKTWMTPTSCSTKQCSDYISVKWSEEDKKRISSILLSIEYCKEQYPNLREYQYDIDWLKSLKERMVSQPKQEWGEEDEKQARQIERIVHNDGCAQKLQKQIADWLESIKDRITWKPTEKQMESIARATNRCISVDDAKALLKLYEDLKKL